MRIFINGGLGNQLFQLAYAHQNIDFNTSQIEIIPDPKPRDDRPFDLNPVVEICSHLKKKGSNYSSRDRFYVLTNKFLQKLSSAHLVPSKVINYQTHIERTPFVFSPPAKSDSRLHFGYFQHWKYVESVWETFGIEISSALNRIILPKRFQSLSLNKVCIVHIRRGDLVRSVDTMGILDSTYYNRGFAAVKKATGENLTLVGISDDYLGAKSISEELNLDYLVGPSELSTWQSIALMSNSRAVICANSTFSWWGGLLAAKTGGVAVVPNPWFLNWHEKVGESFLHPQLTPVPATFLKEIDFKSDFRE